jgi:hypothetical protein
MGGHVRLRRQPRTAVDKRVRIALSGLQNKIEGAILVPGKKGIQSRCTGLCRVIMDCTFHGCRHSRQAHCDVQEQQLMNRL